MTIDQVSGFGRDLLRAVRHLGPTCGQRIADELESVYGKPVPPGRLYPGLDRLEELGLIEIDRSGSNRVGNEYRIADRGERVLEEIASLDERRLAA